jgi:hypothetical protein
MHREPNILTLDLPTPETVGELEEYIQRRLNGRVRHFRLSLRGDGLVLDGQTHTYYAKQLAQHLVMESVNLPIRANDIEVD